MEWLKLNNLIISVLFTVINADIHFNYNNTYKYNEPYTIYVNKNIEYVMEFSGVDFDVYDTPARVTVASVSPNKTYPVFITARQQKGVFSWQLPMLVETPNSVEQFMNISRTLCPHNNIYNEDSCDITSPNTPIIQITSCNPDSVEVTIQVETVQDFYIQLNKTTNFTTTPSQPKYYFFPFQQTADSRLDFQMQSLKKKDKCDGDLETAERMRLGGYLKETKGREFKFYKPKSVVIMIESDDDICAVVSIQNFSCFGGSVNAATDLPPVLFNMDNWLYVDTVTGVSNHTARYTGREDCPVFDNERDILYDGYYLTMTRLGGITLNQDMFPLGFYIVFIVKSSDEDCTDQTITNNQTMPTVAKYIGWKNEKIDVVANNGRVKWFSFVIVQTISYEDYLIAAGGALGFFLSFYLAFIITVLISRKRYCSSNLESLTENEDSEEVTRVTVAPNDVSTSVRRRTSPNGDSVASTSRQYLIEDVIEPANVTSPNECSSSSDSESEYSVLGDIYSEKDVYRLPGKLCVANLARKRPRVLSARSTMYLWNVLTVTVFYTLPVIQLVVTYQRMLNQSGNQDLCYYNFFCAHPFMALSDFNHVYSNIGYVLLGALFLVQVYRRHRQHKARSQAERELGIPQHFGLLYAMGVALVSEGLLSAAYHVCPNSMNFQFDTSFMYVTSVLCMVKIYQNRHPDINARAHATFGVLALIIFIGLVGVLNAGVYFWIIFTVLHLVTCFILTLQIYYMGRFKFDGAMLCRNFRQLISRPLATMTPTYVGRCVLLFLTNLSNWAIAGYGVAQHNRDFASHLLLVLMSNLFLYSMFYIIMKILYRESIRWYSWIFILFTYTLWGCSTYFFMDQSTNWALTPAQSRKSNKVCNFLQLYDSHDIWHFISSIAMFFSFNMYLTIDDDLFPRARSDIMVF